MKNHLLNPKQQNFQNSRYYSPFSKPINPVDRVKEILPWKVSPSEHKSFKQNLQKTSLNSYFIYTVCVIVPSLLLTFRIFPLLVESSAGREHCSFARCLCKANDAVKSVLPWSPTIKFRSKPSRACLLSLQQLRRGGCFPFVCNETSGETNVLGLPPLTSSPSSETCSIGGGRVDRGGDDQPCSSYEKVRGVREIVWRIRDLISPVNDVLVRQVESTPPLDVMDWLVGRNAFD